MLRVPVQRHLTDVLATQAQTDERERSEQWRTELNKRTEREIPFVKQQTDAMAADVTVLGGYRAAFDHEITAAALISSATVAANAANYAILSIQRFRGDGSAAFADIGVVNTRVSPWTAGTTVSVKVNPGAGRVLAGEWVSLVLTKAGAGVALPPLAVSLTQKRKQSWR